MKIRTDFVTNSSSSSFVVSITLTPVEGESIIAFLEDETRLRCTPEDILQAPNIQTLLDTIGRGIEDESGNEELELFGDNVKHSVKKLNDISSITFKRSWYADGEFSSCFGWNIATDAPQVYELAGKICEAEKNGDAEELERLKKEMLFRLMYHEESIQGPGSEFPSRFMGSGASCVLDICDRNDLVGFAHKVVAKNLEDLNVDNGIETTVIDMQSRTFTQQAAYGTQKMKDYTAEKAMVADLAADILAMEEQKKQKRAEAQWRYPELCREYAELLKQITFHTGKIEYLGKRFLISNMNFPELKLKEAGADYSYSYSDRIDYWVIDEIDCSSDKLPGYISLSMYEAMEERISELKECIEKAASGAKLRFLKKKYLFEEFNKEIAAGYPSAKEDIRAWKSGIAFDDVSSVSFEGKTFVLANVSDAWLYRLLNIDRQVQWYDKYPTKTWILVKGGKIANAVSLKCDYLIVGVGADPNIGKTAKALQYRAKGKCQIKLIPEDELLLLLNDMDMRSKS